VSAGIGPAGAQHDTSPEARRLQVGVPESAIQSIYVIALS